jgi:autotransporter-associated beta strand protein
MQFGKRKSSVDQHRRSLRRKSLLLAAAAGVSGLGGAAQVGLADPVTWLGVNSFWGDPANWSSGAVPADDDDVFFYNPSATVFDIVINDASREVGAFHITTDASMNITILAADDPAAGDPLIGRLSIEGSGDIDDIFVAQGSHVINGVSPISPNQELRFGSGDFTMNIATGAQLELAARLQAVNSGNLYRKTGGGTLIISGNNGGGSGWNFSNTTGGMIIDEGVLVMRTTGAFGNSSDRFTVNSGGVLQLEGGYGSTNGGVQAWNDGGIIRAVGADMGFGNGSGSVLLSGTPIIEVVDNTFTISQDIGGTGNLLKQGAGTLVLAGPNTYTGTTTVTTGILAIGVGGNIDSSRLVDVRSGATFDASANGGYTVATNQTLTGRGTVVGPLNLSNSNSLVNPGAVGAAGTLSVTGDFNLSNGTLRLDLANVTTVGGDVNDIVDVTGNLNLSGTTAVAVNRLNGALAPGNYTIIEYSGALSGTAANLLVPTVRQGLTIDLNTVGVVNLVAGNGSAMSLTWSGDGASNVWDLNNAANFTGQTFFDWDTVTFSDSGSNTPDINITGTLQPDAINLSNSTKNYNFTGGGSLINVNNVNKTGAGVATFANGGANVFQNVTVGGGTLAVQNNTSVASLTVNTGGVFQIAPGFNGLVNNGLVNSGGQVLLTGDGTFSALTVASGGTLNVGDGLGANPNLRGQITSDGRTRLNRTDDYTIETNFSGTGVIEKLGNGTATFGGNSSGFTGEVLVSSGAIRVNNNNALGSTSAGTVTLTSGTTFDIAGPAENALNLGARVFRIAGAGVDGNGVLFNSGLRQLNAFQQVVLTADATVGGNTNGGGTTPGRFDIRGGTPQLDLGGFTLTKSGDIQFTLVGVNVTDGNILVNQGTFAVETTTNLTGNGSINLAGTDTRLQFFNTSGTLSVTRPVFVNGTGVQLGNASGQDSFVSSPVTLNNDLTVTNFNSATGGLTLLGNITQTGGARKLTKLGPNALSLLGNNTFTGGVQVDEGTLIANKLSNGTLTVNAGTVQLTAKTVANDPSGTTVVPALTIGGAVVDLTNNSMVIDYTGPVGTLVDDTRQHLQAGRLTTTSGVAGQTGLGYGDNAVLNKATHGGEPVDASSILIKFTYFGDADLNGQVDVADLGALASAWQTAAPWTGGDFDYSGLVDVADLGLLASNWQAGVGSPLGPSFAAALASVGLGNVSVPEPASIGLMGALAAWSLKRPGRRQRR